MGCPGLVPALLGSDIKISEGSRESATPVLPVTDAGIYSRRPSQAFRVAHPSKPAFTCGEGIVAAKTPMCDAGHRSFSAPRCPRRVGSRLRRFA